MTYSSGTFLGGKKCVAPTGIRTLDLPARYYIEYAAPAPNTKYARLCSVSTGKWLRRIEGPSSPQQSKGSSSLKTIYRPLMKRALTFLETSVNNYRTTQRHTMLTATPTPEAQNFAAVQLLQQTRGLPIVFFSLTYEKYSNFVLRRHSSSLKF